MRVSIILNHTKGEYIYTSVRGVSVVVVHIRLPLLVDGSIGYMGTF